MVELAVQGGFHQGILQPLRKEGGEVVDEAAEAGAVEGEAAVSKTLAHPGATPGADIDLHDRKKQNERKHLRLEGCC